MSISPIAAANSEKEGVSADRAASDEEMVSEPVRAEASDQANTDNDAGDPGSGLFGGSDLGPDPGNSDDTPRGGEVF